MIKTKILQDFEIVGEKRFVKGSEVIMTEALFETMKTREMVEEVLHKEETKKIKK